MELDELEATTFEPHAGDRFALDAAGISFVLEEVTTLAARPDGRDPFSLIFRGPSEPVLPQAIYRLEHDALGALEIFIVPLGVDAGGTRYEAIFT
ncbi:MAG TPA: hypothetical protein VFZ89_17730 [Solirubrobacteraceae bacterium]